MAWSVTVLNLGILQYKGAYTKCGQYDNALDGVRWPMDWLMKANPDDNTFIAQVRPGASFMRYTVARLHL